MSAPGLDTGFYSHVFARAWFHKLVCKYISLLFISARSGWQKGEGEGKWYSMTLFLLLCDPNMEESFMVFWGPPSGSWCNTKWSLPSYLFETWQQLFRKKLVLNRISSSPTYSSLPSQKKGCYGILSLPYSHDMTMLSKAGLKCHPSSSPAMAFIVGHLFQPPWIGERLHWCLCLDGPYPGQRCTCQASAWAHAHSCSGDCHGTTVTD